MIVRIGCRPLSGTVKGRQGRTFCYIVHFETVDDAIF